MKNRTIIEVSKEDCNQLMEILPNPPKANETLKKSAELYKSLMKKQ